MMACILESDSVLTDTDASKQPKALVGRFAVREEGFQYVDAEG